MTANYEEIGKNYSAYRREDPWLSKQIDEALGSAWSVVNVGAGAGSYEPRDRHVVAIEPSDIMAGQRGSDRPPAINASAEKLPLRDDSVDAAMSVLSLQHWDDAQRDGVLEMRRVARSTVVIVTYDARVSATWWLTAEYFPEAADSDRATFPRPETIAEWLGGARIGILPIPADITDWMMGSFWAHPERVLDAGARGATSGFARETGEVVNRVVESVRQDLDDGIWDKKYGHLRELSEFDTGLRLIIAEAKRGRTT